MKRPFLPYLPVEKICNALAKAPGNELNSGKISSPESSAALAANTFGLFLDRPSELPAIPTVEVKEDERPYSKWEGSETREARTAPTECAYHDLLSPMRSDSCSRANSRLKAQNVSASRTRRILWRPSFCDEISKVPSKKSKQRESCQMAPHHRQWTFLCGTLGSENAVHAGNSRIQSVNFSASETRVRSAVVSNSQATSRNRYVDEQKLR